MYWCDLVIHVLNDCFGAIGGATGRQEKLSAEMPEPILVTAAFAEAADGEFRSVVATR